MPHLAQSSNRPSHRNIENQTVLVYQCVEQALTARLASASETCAYAGARPSKELHTHVSRKHSRSQGLAHLVEIHAVESAGITEPEPVCG